MQGHKFRRQLPIGRYIADFRSRSVAFRSAFRKTCLAQRRQRSRAVPLQEREDLRGLPGRLLKGRPVAAVVEKDEARGGNVVQDRDADLERRHPVGRGLGVAAKFAATGV